MRRGFTLVELVLVIMVLAILAGFVVPSVGGLSQISTPTGPKSDRQIVTERNMLELRDVIMGSGNGGGIWADVGHIPNRLPRRLSDLFRVRNDPPEPTTPLFDPVTRVGWRGPYAELATGNWSGKINESKNFFQHYATDATSPLTEAEQVTTPAFVDAWGNPIVLQIDFDADGLISPTEAQAARLVSAGPDGVIDWALNPSLTQADYLASFQGHRTDDVVVYLGIVR